MSFLKRQFLVLVLVLLILVLVYGTASDRLLRQEREQKLAAQIRLEVLQELEPLVRNKLQTEVKDQILAELNQDIETIVKEAIAESYQSLAKDVSAASKDPQLALAADDIRLTSSVSFKQAIRDVVQETLAETRNPNRLSDTQLDEYVASGNIVPDLGVGAGINKSSYQNEMQLAANTSQPSGTAKTSSKTTANSSTADAAIPVAEEKRAESIERTLQQRGSVLLGKGKWQIEPSVSWAHFSSNRINIQGFSILPVLVIGDISTEEVKRDVYIQNLSLKYGLLNNFQTEVKIPYRGEHDRITVSSTSESTRQTQGLGDIEIGISRQIGWEHGLMPDLIAAFAVKTPTGREPYNHDIGLGTGHWSYRASLIGVKSSDPAVVFGSLSYTYNMKRNNIDNFGDIDPGDTLGYSLGTAIALSYKTAITFAFDNSVTFRMKRNGRYLADSFLNVANFKTGLNWAINERWSMDVSVSMGLTKDSPDVSLEFRFPFVF